MTRAYLSMSTEDRETFQRAVTNPRVTGGVLADALQLKGYDVDRLAIDHFRRKLRTGRAKL